MTLWIVLGIAAVLILWIIGTYNGLVKSKIKIDNSWSDISVFLKKRFDLIPNIVNTVKGYATHEASAFENVTKARSMAMGAQGPTKAHAEVENMLSGALKSIFAMLTDPSVWVLLEVTTPSHRV